MYTNTLETIKTVMLIQPQAIKDNTEFVGSTGSTPVTVDSLGFHRLKFTVAVGATDIAFAQLRILSSDSATANFTPVATFDPLPSATDDNKLFSVFVANDGTQKRYYRIEAVAGDGAVGTFAVAWCDLSNADNTPNSAADRNHAAEIFVP